MTRCSLLSSMTSMGLANTGHSCLQKQQIQITVEPPRTVTSQQQPPPYNSQCLISLKCSSTIYLTSP